jgi:hypothetical protein
MPDSFLEVFGDKHVSELFERRDNGALMDQGITSSWRKNSPMLGKYEYFSF